LFEKPAFCGVYNKEVRITYLFVSDYFFVYERKVAFVVDNILESLVELFARFVYVIRSFENQAARKSALKLKLKDITVTGNVSLKFEYLEFSL